MSQSRPSPVLEGHISVKKVKIQKKEESTVLHMTKSHPIPVPSQFRPSSVPVPSQSRPSPVLEGHISEKKVEIQKKEESLMWDKAVLCWTKQSHVGQNSLIWNMTVSYKTDQSNEGQSSLVWDRAVICGTEWSHVEGSSIV